MVGALGVVFGDIGTSPLYAFRVAVGIADASDAGTVLGILSLITWSLILVVTIKYVAFILRADNEGEGGILSLVALMKLHRRQETRNRRILLLVAIFGGALLFGDAVLTPAISVLSAIEGLKDIAPSYADWTVPIAIAIVAGLFVAQAFGVARIGIVFGPVMLVWFATLAISGIAAIFAYPEVLAALSPHYAIALFLDYPYYATAFLGAVFLAVTGGEALYADLGQFGRPAITRAWLVIVLPALLLNYFGQGAMVIADHRFSESTFYSLFPAFLLPAVVLLAAIASVIASQAVITGLASLTSQAIRLGFLPPMSVSYLSAANPHDVYVPVVNLLVGALTIAVVAGFGSSAALADAYGIAVAGAMITTTVLFIAYERSRPRRGARSRAWAAVPFAFLLIDLVFILANAGKIPSGGALPLLLALAVFGLIQCWRIGQARLDGLRMGEQVTIRDYLRGRPAPTVTCERTAIFLARPGIEVPRALAEMTALVGVRFERVVIVSVRTFSVPRLKGEDRIKVERIADRNLVRVLIGVGYLQRINLPALLGETLNELGVKPETATYIVGLERPVAPAILSDWLAPVLAVYAFMARLALRPTDRFLLPPSRTLEVGMPRRL
ncbi:potassium transporter Kup [Fulvimarina endophytica]|uniref:Probable potassium transport system protein Kup n=2 Tax=Fulvimarina endophytica TaxID=2293836 RepID=A0A371X024_9HYPH|nr:potassium transporter Kup [Fulvimarina endophytica]